MNVLNEDSPDDQRRWLLAKRVRVQKIGRDIGRSGLKDDGIIPCLLQLNRPTFFTLYQNFCDRRLCHQEYCIVYLEMDDDVVADYVRRVLRHPELNSKRNRMGLVIRVTQWV